ncbi:hypothetical protein F4604DRAFT_1718848, partial [Suillus subluteus]
MARTHNVLTLRWSMERLQYWLQTSHMEGSIVISYNFVTDILQLRSNFVAEQTRIPSSTVLDSLFFSMFHVLHSLVPVCTHMFTFILVFFSYLCISVLVCAHPHTSALIFARFHMSALGFTPILTLCVRRRC